MCGKEVGDNSEDETWHFQPWNYDEGIEEYYIALGNAFPEYAAVVIMFLCTLITPNAVLATPQLIDRTRHA